MIERNGTIYGFLEAGAQNAFFYAAARPNATAQVTPYTGAAADAYFPVPSQYNNKQNISMTRRVTYYRKSVYAIDESHANALYVPLYPLNVGSVSFDKSDTWGLIVSEQLGTAFGTYNVAKEDIMPYAIQDDGTLNRSGFNTISGGAGDSASVDQQLGLLYTCAAFNGLQVFDAATGNTVPFAGSNPVPGIAGIGGT
jgi:hypothetical protein